MLCKCHWIVLFTVHFTAFCSGGPFFFPVTVYMPLHCCGKYKAPGPVLMWEDLTTTAW